MPALAEDDNTDTTPEVLKPFLFQGIELNHGKSSVQAVGDCPFCGKESKFSVNIENGKWGCWACGNKSASPHVFLRSLYDTFTTDGIEGLAEDREYLSAESAIEFGVRYSPHNERWYVPGYNNEGTLCQLYRYTPVIKNGETKHRLFATTGMGQHLFGAHLYDEKKPNVIVCEGPWDAIALHELLGSVKKTETGHAYTSNSKRSLLAETNIIALPGCEQYKDAWDRFLIGKHVTIIFDNDHPIKNKQSGKIVEPAAFRGIKKLAVGLKEASKGPKSLRYLKWGDNGYDPELPSGLDIRDVVKEGSDIQERVKLLCGILGKIEETPEDWYTDEGLVKKYSRGKKVGLSLKECSDYKTLKNAWKRALKWTEGLDAANTVMLASIASTMCVGDQLWIKVIGPASCGKSTLCEAMSTSEHVLAKSTIRGFHSGFESGDGKDHSLINQLKGKTLVTKDGDTLLQSPNLPQILAEARDVYDRTSRTHYRNATSKDYNGISMTWILCGTNSLRSIDSSELGERFLDCVIMEHIDEDMEQEVLLRVANQAQANAQTEVTADLESQQSPELTEVMQLTGGYINYLRANANKLLKTVSMDDKAIKECMLLGKFVSFMRARPSVRQLEKAEREFAARLVSQLVRISMCSAIVLNETTISENVLKITRKVALDTARGRTMKIVCAVAQAGEEGKEAHSIAHEVHGVHNETRGLLRFLTNIGALESFHKVGKRGSITGSVRWKLSPSMQVMYSQIFPEENSNEKTQRITKKRREN